MALDAAVNQQASIITYINDFKLMMLVCLVVIRCSSDAPPAPSHCRPQPRRGDGLIVIPSVARDLLRKAHSTSIAGDPSLHSG